MTKKILEPRSKRRFVTLITILVILFIISTIFSWLFSLFTDTATEDGDGNVALIPVKGAIATENGGGPFSAGGTSSTDIIAMIEKAKKDPGIKGVIFEINSPGGSAVASDEIGQAVKSLGKPSVAWIRELGASGAYWVASETDHIVANRMSITGSVGVIGSYLEFSGLLERYNVSYEKFTSGKYKDLGSPFVEPNDEERKIFQQKLDMIHEIFKEEVRNNRNLSDAQMKDVETGLFYLGTEALDLGLVDELGGKQEAVAYLESQINETARLVRYQRKKTLLEQIGGLQKASAGSAEEMFTGELADERMMVKV